jgi:hypothetical protein
MMSCQLITSASLLMNKDLVKEAKRIVEEEHQQQQELNHMQPTTLRKSYLQLQQQQQQHQQQRIVPPLNPRQYPQRKDQCEQTFNNEINAQLDCDASKPPPMETSI